MVANINWRNESEVNHLIKETKKNLRSLMKKDFKLVWAELGDAINKKVELLKADEKQYGTAIPTFSMEDILQNKISQPELDRFLDRGAVVIKNVIPRDYIEELYTGLQDYVEVNDYINQKIDPNLDTYFSNLKSQKPQIYNIFWSKCQVLIRQHENVARVKQFLNSFWISKRGNETYFRPDQEFAYADRFRIRNAGDNTLGLSPHIDGGSVERWLDSANQKIYHKIFSGDWQDYMPYDGEYRNEIENIPSPAVCRAFRTYQAWIALSSQGPGDGTLQLVPMVKEATAYLLLRPFIEGVPEEEFCGAVSGKAQAINSQWHVDLLKGLVSIPHMDPGDTVWWHCDLVHAVESEHRGKVESSVTYIGSAPWCERNEKFAQLQKPCFETGESSPDFAAEHREVSYKGRATVDDLSELGKKQMGFLPWG